MSKKSDKKPFYIGGQAVIEGVMMRGKTLYAMAVRSSNGDIVVEKEKIDGAVYTNPFFKLPIIRGIVSFITSLVIGTKILMRSAEIAGDDIAEEEEPSKFEKFLQDKFGEKFNDILIYFSVAVSLIMGIAIFFLLPTFLGSFFKNLIPTWALGIIEGILRIIIFLVYIFIISRMKEIQRVFQYHGAEHKTINCYESGEELTVENIKKHTRLHKRCGTSFLFIVMLVSMVLFVFVRVDTIWLRMLSRILFVPVVAGISYEIIRWAGSSESPLVKIVSLPGFCIQKITTAEPDGKQIETAVAALKGVLEDAPQ